MFDYEYQPEQTTGAPCIICGLPQTRNPHPNAGKPSHLNIVGAMWGCLPCAEKRANGRQRVLSMLFQWLDEEVLRESSWPQYLLAIRRVQERLKDLETSRRTEYHAGARAVDP